MTRFTGRYRAEGSHARGSPDSGFFPHARTATDGRQRGSAGANPLARHDVDLDASFLERPQDPRVIGAVRTRPAQDERGAAFR